MLAAVASAASARAMRLLSLSLSLSLPLSLAHTSIHSHASRPSPPPFSCARLSPAPRPSPPPLRCQVSYRDLSEHSPTLAIWLADAPKDMLEIFDEVANDVVIGSDYFPAYKVTST